jgi:hypothetical protein
VLKTIARHATIKAVSSSPSPLQLQLFVRRGASRGFIFATGRDKRFSHSRECCLQRRWEGREEGGGAPLQVVGEKGGHARDISGLHGLEGVVRSLRDLVELDGSRESHARAKAREVHLQRRRVR